MKGNRIYRAIRLTGLKHLIFPILSVAIAVGIYYILPFSDIFFPPEADSSADAVAFYRDGHNYAVINLDKLYYTGFDIMEGGEHKASYYYDLTGNRCTFYLIDSELAGNRALELTDVSINVRLDEKDGLMENMIAGFSTSLGWTSEGMTEITNGVVMNQTAYSPVGYIIAFIGIMLYVIYSMVIITVNVIFVLVPQIHISLLRFYSYRRRGIVRGLKELKKNIENYIVLESGNMYVSNKYFYNLGKNEVCIIPLETIVLGYEHGRLIQFFGLHIRMTYTLYFKDIRGRKYMASGKSLTEVTKITEYLRENYPDMLWGHTKENTEFAKLMIKEYKKRRKKSVA